MNPADIDTAALARLGSQAFAKIEERHGRVERALSNGVPLALVCAVLAPDFDAALEPVVHARRWIDEKPDGIQVLRAGLGVGKSVAAAMYAIATGAMWVQASDVARWTFESQGLAIARWCSFPDLVIDEIGGQGTTSPVEAGRLSQVVLERWARGRSTLLTTNLAKRAFAEVYDGTTDLALSRTLDRIAERGDWQDCKGPSRRTAPADTKAGRRRLEDWRKLAALVDVVQLAASGFDVDGLDDPAGPKAKLAALLCATPDDITAARAAIAEEARKVADFAAPFLAKWEAEREQARAEQRVATDGVRELVLRHIARAGGAA